MLGVRNTDGREYQDFFNAWFVQNSNPSNLSFVKQLNNARSVGRFISTDFGESNVNGNLVLNEVTECSITPTEYKDNDTAAPTTTVNNVTDNVGALNDDDLPF